MSKQLTLSGRIPMSFLSIFVSFFAEKPYYLKRYSGPSIPLSVRIVSTIQLGRLYRRSLSLAAYGPDPWAGRQFRREDRRRGPHTLGLTRALCTLLML